MAWLPDGEKNSKISLFVLAQLTNAALMHRIARQKTKNSTPSKYKMAKDIQTPPGLYDYVAELSCCAKSKQTGLPNFAAGIGEV